MDFYSVITLSGLWLLAVPSDKNSEVLECFPLTHCVGLVRKIGLLSISLCLKTVVLPEPNDQNPEFLDFYFFLYKTHIRLAKKSFPAFFDQLHSRIGRVLTKQSNNPSVFLLQIVSRFQILYQKCVWMILN